MNLLEPTCAEKKEKETAANPKSNAAFFSSRRIVMAMKLLDVWASCKWHSITIQIPVKEIRMKRVKSNESLVPVETVVASFDLAGTKATVPTFDAIFPRPRPGTDEEDEGELYRPNVRAVFSGHGKVFGPKEVEMAIDEILGGIARYAGDDIGMLLHIYPRSGIYQRSAPLSTFRLASVYERSEADGNPRNRERVCNRWLSKRHKELLRLIAARMTDFMPGDKNEEEFVEPENADEENS